MQSSKCAVILALFCFIPTASSAETMACVVTRKLDILSNIEYTAEDLERAKYSVVLAPEANTVSRCSFQESVGEVTCDSYSIDRSEVAAGFVDIKKFYYFAGQFDLQLFDNSSFIENNGRGSVATGICVPL